ncbi:MAG: DUF4296 domain-containing protein [Bacteroidales bacterium]|jgi:hypothetical protein|nr:DUF4296 domain-containing protein [Bacteroidales bacterium]
MKKIGFHSKIIGGCCLFVTVLFISCNKNQKLEKPDNLIDRSTMIEMMTDQYLIECMINIAAPEVDRTAYMKDLYGQLFKKYNISDSTYVASITYYVGEKEMANKLLQDALKRMEEKRDSVLVRYNSADTVR